MSDEKSDFETQITRALDDQVARLDGATRSRLRQARARAVDSLAQSPGRHLRWWLPAGAVLASLVAVVLWWGSVKAPSGPTFAAPADFELLTAGESLDLYENLDFYLWLEREAERAG